MRRATELQFSGRHGVPIGRFAIGRPAGYGLLAMGERREAGKPIPHIHYPLPKERARRRKVKGEG